MRNVYIGLLLESILSVLLTFVTYYGHQTIETVFEVNSLSGKLGWVSVFWTKYNF